MNQFIEVYYLENSRTKNNKVQQTIKSIKFHN